MPHGSGRAGTSAGPEGPTGADLRLLLSLSSRLLLLSHARDRRRRDGALALALALARLALGLGLGLAAAALLASSDNAPLLPLASGSRPGLPFPAPSCWLAGLSDDSSLTDLRESELRHLNHDLTGALADVWW